LTSSASPVIGFDAMGPEKTPLEVAALLLIRLFSGV